MCNIISAIRCKFLIHLWFVTILSTSCNLLRSLVFLSVIRYKCYKYKFITYCLPFQRFVANFSSLFDLRVSFALSYTLQIFNPIVTHIFWAFKITTRCELYILPWLTLNNFSKTRAFGNFSSSFRVLFQFLVCWKFSNDFHAFPEKLEDSKKHTSNKQIKSSKDDSISR